MKYTDAELIEYISCNTGISASRVETLLADEYSRGVLENALKVEGTKLRVYYKMYYQRISGISNRTLYEEVTSLASLLGVINHLEGIIKVV